MRLAFDHWRYRLKVASFGADEPTVLEFVIDDLDEIDAPQPLDPWLDVGVV